MFNSTLFIFDYSVCMKGDAYSDVCAVSWCPTCVGLQMLKELKNRGLAWVQHISSNKKTIVTIQTFSFLLLQNLSRKFPNKFLISSYFLVLILKNTVCIGKRRGETKHKMTPNVVKWICLSNTVFGLRVSLHRRVRVRCSEVSIRWSHVVRLLESHFSSTLISTSICIYMHINYIKLLLLLFSYAPMKLQYYPHVYVDWWC